MKLKLPRRRKGVYESFSSRWKSRKSLVLIIPWHLAKLVKNFVGIIVDQHPTVRRQMVFLRERYAELKRELLQYCCYQAWTKNGGLIPWNVNAICEDLVSDSKTPYERRFAEPFNGPVIPFGNLPRRPKRT